LRAFHDESLRAACEESLPPEERRLLHRARAAWLEAELGREPASTTDASVAARIADHWLASDDPPRSKPWHRFVAKLASRSGAFRESAERWTKLLALCESFEETRDALLEREETWRRLGRHAEANADVAELRRLALARDDRGTLRELLVREALSFDARGDKRAALAKAEEAAAIPAPCEIDDARLLIRIAMFRTWLSELDDAARTIDRALSIARSHRDRTVEAEALEVAALGAYFRGDFDRAIETFEAALALRRELGDRHRAGAVESNMGLIALDRGQLDVAEERFASALKHFRGAGYRRGVAASAMNLGLVSIELGRFETALDLLHESLRIRDEIDDLHGRGADTGNIALVWMRLGLAERARPLLEKAASIARRTGNRSSERINLCRLATLALTAGEIDAARTWLERARNARDVASKGGVDLDIDLTEARIAIDAGEPRAAIDRLASARKAAHAAGRRARLVEATILAARAELASGALDEAHRTAHEAINLIESLPPTYERAAKAWLIVHEISVARHTAGLIASPDFEALARAHAALRRIADEIRDVELRRSYLERVPLHRRIVDLHSAHVRQARSDAELRERSFYEIARSIHSIRELDPLLERLLELAIHTTHADKGLILLRENDGRLTVRAARGMHRESVEDATDICQSVIADVAGGGEPVIAVDAGSDERFKERHSIISFRIRTLLCAPLSTRDRVLGAVYVDGRGDASFQPSDLDWLVSFGRLAAVAVENARLVEELRRENRELRRKLEASEPEGDPEGIVGRSPAMRRLLAFIERIAR
ncbi:MAG TPA: tetratricopeptide repeat protein, partial [Planctomycetota bacterium]|nr:tetratricopeptide repeat protein [Planctomycetota bacterium]